VQDDLQRLSQLVGQLGEATAQRFGQVDQSLRAHHEVTSSLQGTTNSLREALASSNARGQWGERMAEDVLRSAGFQEGLNYVKRRSLTGDATGIPDFTFTLPRSHVLFMDVKFPMAAYLRFLEAGTEAERQAHRATFVKDVRARVRELAKREYARNDDRLSVDNVLLFVPNESLTAFIHESDAGLIDEAMSSNVILCSPLTLFAFLGVIRQAFDNFAIEQTSKEILGLLGKFGQQWSKYSDQVDKVRRQFETVSRNFDELATTRRRALERPLAAIDDLRRKQALPVDGELFSLDVDDTAPTERYGTVRELGA
jgi:DNA recombination protein RmuC